MDAGRFCSDFEQGGLRSRPISDVVDEWENEKKAKLVEDFRGLEIFVAELLADASIGDGLLNEISPELLAAFAARRGESLDSYDEVRDYLKEMLTHGDPAVGGLIKQIKGQIAELDFVHQANGHAYLASSTSQEAWDVAVKHAFGGIEYVQVKIRTTAGEVVNAMLDVQRKVAAGTITDHEQIVSHINFAVNEDIAEAVRAKAAMHPELVGMKVYTIPVTNSELTSLVADGFDNVGPNEIAHLFDEIFAGSLTVACLHGMANAFLYYKGSKTAAAGIEGAMIGSAFSVLGIIVAKGAAIFASGSKVALLSGHPVIAAIISGMVARTVAKKWYESRENTAAMLAREVDHMRDLGVSLTRA